MEHLNALWNLAPKNPTQTAYSRFLKTPGGVMRTMFSDSQDAWQKLGDDAMKTAYDSLWKKEATYD